MALKQIAAKKRNQKFRKSDDQFVENEESLPFAGLPRWIAVLYPISDVVG